MLVLIVCIHYLFPILINLQMLVSCSFFHIFVELCVLSHNGSDQRILCLACRLYTGIHAKAKPKFKTGAISESTTALNVDQTNSSVHNAEVKSAPSGAPIPLQSSLPPSTATTRGNSQETAAVVSSSTVATVVSAPPQKKEGGLAKAQADKKKIDARKKSLKRL